MGNAQEYRDNPGYFFVRLQSVAGSPSTETVPRRGPDCEPTFFLFFFHSIIFTINSTCIIRSFFHRFLGGPVRLLYSNNVNSNGLEGTLILLSPPDRFVTFHLLSRVGVSSKTCFSTRRHIFCLLTLPLSVPEE